MSVIPALWEAELDRSLEVRSSRSAWLTRRNLVSAKNTKMNRAWFRVPVIQATKEAEAGESLVPRRQQLQWAIVVSLLCSLVTEKDSVSKKKKLKIEEFPAMPLLSLHAEYSYGDCKIYGNWVIWIQWLWIQNTKYLDQGWCDLINSNYANSIMENRALKQCFVLLLLFKFL